MERKGSAVLSALSRARSPLVGKYRSQLGICASHSQVSQAPEQNDPCELRVLKNFCVGYS